MSGRRGMGSEPVRALGLAAAGTRVGRAWVLALAALSVAAALPAPARAQSKTGTTIGQFLLIEPSARLTAMGNAGVGVDAGLEGVYYNPAAAGRVRRLEVLLSHADWFAGIRYDYAAAAIPLGRWGTAFTNVTSLGSGEIDVRTVSQPLGTGERYTASDVAIGVGYGYAISERFAAGVQVRFLEETVWHSTASAVTFDVGTLYRIRPLGLHLGSSLSNFGTSGAFSGRDLRITYDNDPTRFGDNGTLPGERFTQDYPVPVLFRVGVGLPYRLTPDLHAMVAVAASHPNDNSESVSGGVELSYRDVVAVRTGYQSLFKQDSEEGFAAGVGLKGRLQAFDYRVDYAWADYGRLEGVHRLTLGLLY
jgi:hypothetical protein